jgi:hypothetical protein
MDGLPAADDLHSLLIRTDFSDDVTWAAVRRAITTPSTVFRANLHVVDDRRYDGLTIDGLLAMSDGSDQGFVFLVDRETIARPDHPVLVVDLVEDSRGRRFRVVPSAMWSVQNNLIVANMDWEDFSESVDADGVFRGFGR